MHLVGMLIRDHVVRTIVHDALRQTLHVGTCESPQRILLLLRRVQVSAVLIDLVDNHGRSSAPFISTIREQHPALPIVGVLHPKTFDWRKMVPAVRAGISEILVIGVDDIGSVIRAICVDTGADAGVTAVLGVLAPHVPAAACPILEYCLRGATTALSTKQLAAALGVPRSTLNRRFKRAGLLSPGSLLMWTRLFLAAQLLERGERTVEDIAKSLRFDSVVSFRRVVRRLARLRPAEIRMNGGIQAILPQFLEALANRSTQSAA